MYGADAGLCFPFSASHLILLTLPSLNFSGKFKINSPLILFLIPPDCNPVITVYTCAQ